jgi:transposase InsO family protein
MSKSRLVITAVVVEGRSQHEVARAYGVSQPWISRLVARYRAEGDAAFEPHPRRPARSPSATSPAVQELVLRLRKQLLEQGLDAGAHTIRWHLQQHHQTIVSVATVWRVLSRHGQVVAEPKKRPKASYLRFEAEFPNQMWQTDFTHYRLADGHDVEILSFLDDHSRYLLACVAFPRVTGRAVVDTFRDTIARHGTPASVLSDNGMVFTTRFAGGRAGRNARNGFAAEPTRHGVVQKNSAPNHPQTCGKIERFHQTLKRWLTAQPDQPATIAELQALLDLIAVVYNDRRPHRALARRTPRAAYLARPKATPTGTPTTGQPDVRVRRDRIDTSGVVTVRYHGRLHHIGIGRTHARTHVLLLIHDRDIRVINEHTGELLRELVLDRTRDYQPLGQPPGPPRTNPEPYEGSGLCRCLETSQWSG